MLSATLERVPSKQASGPLSGDEVGMLAEASLSDAVELIKEARHLFAQKMYPRSYSVARLAGEEVGKCQLAVGMAGKHDAVAAYWKEWWRTFYSHGPKLARSAIAATQLLPVELIDSFLSILEPALNDQRREAGFYVDYVAGKPRGPSDAITAQVAFDAINCMGSVILSYDDHFSDGGLAEFFTLAHINDAIAMRAALGTRDREVIGATWAKTTGASAEDEFLNFLMGLYENDARDR